jgi:HEAT repeat protein
MEGDSMSRMTPPICIYLIVILIAFFLQGTFVHACPLCGATVDESADERFNKPLADLRILYERKGKEALPDIREVLRTGTDPFVIQRAANYLVDLDDRESIQQMESMVLDIVRQVAFTPFGLGTPGFHSRLSVAYALGRFGPTTVGDRIWGKYDRLDWNRKSEVAYILSALKDPHLDERMAAILNKEEDYQLMQGALEAMIVSGSHQSLPFLHSKVEAWLDKPNGIGTNPGPGEPTIYYKLLMIKANTAILFIDSRWKRAQQ